MKLFHANMLFINFASCVMVILRAPLFIHCFVELMIGSRKISVWEDI